MKAYPSIEHALAEQSDYLTQAMNAYKYKEIDEAELRYRLVSCADVLFQLQGHADRQREKEARGGYLTVTFDTESRELPDLFVAVPSLMNLLRNTESALGLVADHLADLDSETVPLTAQLAVLHLVGQALRASMDADFAPINNLRHKLVAAHFQHCEAKNALAEGVAA